MPLSTADIQNLFFLAFFLAKEDVTTWRENGNRQA